MKATAMRGAATLPCSSRDSKSTIGPSASIIGMLIVASEIINKTMLELELTTTENVRLVNSGLSSSYAFATSSAIRRTSRPAFVLTIDQSGLGRG